MRRDLSRLRERQLPLANAAPRAAAVVASPGVPLDRATLARVQPRFGADFCDVRVHADQGAAESAHALNANAYTVGRDIVFGAGRYAPRSEAGLRLLTHELTHVLQQRGAPARAVTAPDDAAEREAEHFAAGPHAAGKPAAVLDAAIARQPQPKSDPPLWKVPKFDVAAATKTMQKIEAEKQFLSALWQNLPLADKYDPDVARYIRKLLPQRVALWKGEHPQTTYVGSEFLENIAVDTLIAIALDLAGASTGVGILVGIAVSTMREKSVDQKLADCKEMVLDSRNDIPAAIDIALRKILGKGKRDVDTPEELNRQIRLDVLEKTKTTTDRPLKPISVPKGGPK